MRDSSLPSLEVGVTEATTESHEEIVFIFKIFSSSITSWTVSSHRTIWGVFLDKKGICNFVACKSDAWEILSQRETSTPCNLLEKKKAKNQIGNAIKTRDNQTRNKVQNFNILSKERIKD